MLHWQNYGDEKGSIGQSRPHYKDAREFSGMVFKDTRLGQNYAPYDSSFVIDDSMLFKIRDALKKAAKIGISTTYSKYSEIACLNSLSKQSVKF